MYIGGGGEGTARDGHSVAVEAYMARHTLEEGKKVGQKQFGTVTSSSEGKQVRPKGGRQKINRKKQTTYEEEKG